MRAVFELDVVQCVDGEACPCLPAVDLVECTCGQSEHRFAFRVAHKPNVARALRSQDGHP